MEDKTLYYNEVIEEIAEVIETGRGFGDVVTLYRGENECFPLVSSGLYRCFSEYDTWGAKSENEKEQFLFNYERKIVQHAAIFSGYGGEDYSVNDRKDVEKFSSKQWNLLAEIQHRGGKTNLIDFTRDVNIALFFACYNRADSVHNQSRLSNNTKNGRIILYHHVNSKPEHDTLVFPEAGYSKAQSSVLVRPRSSGIIDINKSWVNEVIIPSKKKKELLGCLAAIYDIRIKTIYDDLHGYIDNQYILFPELNKKRNNIPK